MSGGGEIIIRNGTLWNWLTYTIVFGGSQDEYTFTGGKRVKAYWIIGGLVLALALAIAL